jgi:hypothetical protein
MEMSTVRSTVDELCSGGIQSKKSKIIGSSAQDSNPDHYTVMRFAYF